MVEKVLVGGIISCLDLVLFRYAKKKENSRVIPCQNMVGTLVWGGKTLLTPVTMERQMFEMPEDPSQTLPERSPMGPIL